MNKRLGTTALTYAYAYTYIYIYIYTVYSQTKIYSGNFNISHIISLFAII